MKFECALAGRYVGASVRINMVLKLSDSLLRCGRTVVTDNYYSNVELTSKLLDHDTHHLGTLHAIHIFLAHYILTRKEINMKFISAEFKMRDLIAMENSKGIMILKWHDKRGVAFSALAIQMKVS
jgi:hypothetical protein